MSQKINWLERNQNKNNCLAITFLQMLISRVFLPPVSHGEKCGKFQFDVEITPKAVFLFLYASSKK